MSKKGFGKFLLGAAVIGAAAALLTYVKQSQSKEDLRDDFDDFDDELNEEIFDHEAISKETADRHYVTIPLDQTTGKSAESFEESDVSSEPSPASEQAAPKASFTSQVELDVEDIESNTDKDIHAFNLEDENQ